MLRLIIVGLLISYTPYRVDLDMQPTEICDNAIDDDGDGLIDLNDDECLCPVAEPISLIPNPSFEDNSCCPTTRSQLHCADTWIQASQATTDYLHTCGWFGWEDLPVPLPIPDGDACIGFRDGRAGSAPNANWKEYTGACLTSPLKIGTAYRFRFNIGFTHPENSPPTTVVFYGSTSCEFLPFGEGDDTHGCPLNGPGWVRLGQTRVFGANSWTTAEINVTPQQDIFAMAIGPDCIERMRDVSLYYFLDNLVLADQREFLFTISPDSNLCAVDFSLSVPNFDSLNYQWYKDKVALVGETSSTLKVKSGDGLYQVLIKGPASCKLTNPYLLSEPVIHTTLNEHFCEQESFFFAGKERSESGTYFDTLLSRDGCDSIIQINLSKVSSVTVSDSTKIFDGETYQVGDFNFQNPTSEVITLASSLGCDSIVQLTLDFYDVYIPNAFSPNNDGINDHLTLYGTQELIRVNRIQIYSRWGQLIYENENMQDTQAILWNGRDKDRLAEQGVYLYRINLTMNDGLDHELSGSITLLH